MIQETKLTGSIEEAFLRYEGTEIIPTDTIMEITGQRSLEITAESPDRKVRINIMLHPRLDSRNDFAYVGTFTIEQKKRE